MSTPGIGDVLGDSGALPEITCDGKTWKIGKPTQRAKDALEELIVADAVREITSLKEVIPGAAYKELWGDLRAAIANKEYRTWGPGWLAGLDAFDGDIKFLTSLLRERHDEATVADAKGLIEKNGDEVELALARVVPSFLYFLAESLPAPPEMRKKVIDDLTAKILSRLSKPTTPIANA